MAFKDSPAPHGATKNISRDQAEGRDRVYTHQPYPAMRYHLDGRECIVQDEAKDKALGEGWSAKSNPPRPAGTVRPDPTMAEIKEATALLIERHHSHEKTIADLNRTLADLSKFSAEQSAAMEKLQAENEALRKELLDNLDLEAPKTATEDAPVEAEAASPQPKRQSARFTKQA